MQGEGETRNLEINWQMGEKSTGENNQSKFFFIFFYLGIQLPIYIKIGTAVAVLSLNHFYMQLSLVTRY